MARLTCELFDAFCLHWAESPISEARVSKNQDHSTTPKGTAMKIASHRPNKTVLKVERDESIPPSSNVRYLKLVPAEPSEHDEPDAPRAPYSFDMTQPDTGGFVLIDACVPAAMGIEFMNLLAMYHGD